MKKIIILFLMFVSVLFSSSTVLADQDSLSSKEPMLEARLKAMSKDLRCLVCQNSTLADSDAPLAEDLRKEILVQMRAGKTDAEIVDYLVARYGNFVRYKPPVNSDTALLWFGPFFLLLIGGFVLYRALKKQENASAG